MAVAADGDGGSCCGGGGGGGRGAGQVAADADVRVEDHAPAQHDVLGPVEEGAPGDFVAGVGFDEGGFGFGWGGGGGGGHCGEVGWLMDGRSREGTMKG